MVEGLLDGKKNSYNLFRKNGYRRVRLGGL